MTATASYGGSAETGRLNVSFTNVLNAGNSGTAILPTDDAYDCYSGPNFTALHAFRAADGPA